MAPSAVSRGYKKLVGLPPIAYDLLGPDVDLIPMDEYDQIVGHSAKKRRGKSRRNNKGRPPATTQLAHGMCCQVDICNRNGVPRKVDQEEHGKLDSEERPNNFCRPPVPISISELGHGGRAYQDRMAQNLRPSGPPKLLPSTIGLGPLSQLPSKVDPPIGSQEKQQNYYYVPYYNPSDFHTINGLVTMKPEARARMADPNTRLNFLQMPMRDPKDYYLVQRRITPRPETIEKLAKTSITKITVCQNEPKVQMSSLPPLPHERIQSSQRNNFSAHQMNDAQRFADDLFRSARTIGDGEAVPVRFILNNSSMNTFDFDLSPNVRTFTDILMLMRLVKEGNISFNTTRIGDENNYTVSVWRAGHTTPVGPNGIRYTDPIRTHVDRLSKVIIKIENNRLPVYSLDDLYTIPRARNILAQDACNLIRNLRLIRDSEEQNNAVFNSMIGNLPYSLSAFVITNASAQIIPDILNTIISGTQNVIHTERTKVLTNEEFNNLNHFVYNSSTLNRNEGVENCSICQDNLQNGENSTKLPCSHIFHMDCIKHWLVSQCSSCPNCRHDIKGSGEGRMDIECPMPEDDGFNPM